MFCSNKFEYLVILLLVLIFMPNAISCELDFDGSQFLKESYSKGASPTSTCFETNVNENKFYAFPDKICELIFTKSGWLDDDWRFEGIQGGGTFNVKKYRGGITVELEASGGFRLNSITLHSDTADCDKTTLDMVLY